VRERLDYSQGAPSLVTLPVVCLVPVLAGQTAIEQTLLETQWLLPLLFTFSFVSQLPLSHPWRCLSSSASCTRFRFFPEFRAQFDIRSINQLLEFFLAHWRKLVLIGADLRRLVCLKEVVGVGNTNISIRFALVMGCLLTHLVVSLVHPDPFFMERRIMVRGGDVMDLSVTLVRVLPGVEVIDQMHDGL